MENPIAAQYTVDWYRIPLPAGRLQELNQRSDGRALVQAGGHCALMAMSGAAAVWAALAGHYGWLFPILVVHGTICAFMINAVHELVHGTVFRTRWLNIFFVHLFAFIGWINHRAFWASHSEHHTYTMHFPHDQENVLPIRFRFWDVLVMSIFNWNALRYPLLATIRLSCGRLKGQWEEKVMASPERQKPVFAWSRWTLAGHVTIAAVSLYHGLWIIPVVVSLTPFYGQMLFFFLNSAQHVGLQPDVRDFRLNCRTIEVNPLFRFLYWNMNYHIEHHMYAAVPCYRLRALHHEIKHACPPVLNGLVATWYHIVSILWRQDAEPGYTYQAQIPGEPIPQSAPVVAATQLAGAPARALATEARKVWQCAICGFIYDEVMGLPKDGIAPGTAWAAIPDSWRCPDCAIGKADFAMVEIQRPVAHVGPVNEPVVIIGSGMAAYTLARDIRRLDQTVPVTVLTQDEGDAYIKPLLSSALAHGRAAGELVQTRASDLAKELNLTIRTATTVERIDRERRVVVTNHGEVAYGRLVLAVGSEPFRAALEGDAAQRALSVNNLADYGVFRNQLRPGASVAIVGGGLIGCEFANDLIAAGYQVRVIDRAAAPLSALVPTDVGHGLQRALTSVGVIWHAGMSLHAVNHHADGRLALTVSDGSVYTADVVLSAIGLRPRLALATTAGLATTRGIVVDRQLRTSDPAIFALGDCAEIDGQVLPFVAPLMHSARALAATLTGTPTAVVWPLLPITVKTPAFPVVVVSPGKAAGSWQVSSQEAGITARYRNAAGQVLGVIVAGSAVAQREAVCAEMAESTQALALAG